MELFLQDQRKMKTDLEEEKKARKSLENMIKKLMKGQTTTVSNKDVEENHT
jgi:hypothetical protein